MLGALCFLLDSLCLLLDTLSLLLGALCLLLDTLCLLLGALCLLLGALCLLLGAVLRVYSINCARKGRLTINCGRLKDNRSYNIYILIKILQNVV